MGIRQKMSLLPVYWLVGLVELLFVLEVPHSSSSRYVVSFHLFSGGRQGKGRS